MSGYILNCAAAVGLVLIVVGTIAAFMFVFSIGKVKGGGKNKLNFGIAGIEITVETGYVYFAVIVGLLLVILPFPISGHFGEVSMAKAEERATPTTSRLEEGEYNIRKEEITIDLRNQKEIGVAGYLGSELSEIEWQERIEIKDVKVGIEEVNILHATTGHSIAVIDKPACAKWRRVKEKSKTIYNPFYDMLKGETSFKAVFRDLIKRGGGMRTYYMTVPITGDAVRVIVYKLKYRNAFQGRNFEWAGKALSSDTDILTLHIKFPKDKPFKSKSYKTSKKESPDAVVIDIDNPEIEIAPDNSTLTWKIRDAKKGERYYIKWSW